MKISRIVSASATALAVLLPTVPTPATAQTAGERGVYLRAVAEHHDVTPAEVMILSDWGIGPEEVAVALFMSKEAGVSTDALVALQRAGQGWSSLAVRYGLTPRTFYVELPAGASAGPLDPIYVRFRGSPAAEWGGIPLTDAHVVQLVNLRFVSEFLQVPPVRVIEALSGAGSFVGAYLRLIGR